MKTIILVVSLSTIPGCISPDADYHPTFRTMPGEVADLYKEAAITKCSLEAKKEAFTAVREQEVLTVEEMVQYYKMRLDLCLLNNTNIVI